jgi:hypothetical protein
MLPWRAQHMGREILNNRYTVSSYRMPPNCHFEPENPEAIAFCEVELYQSQPIRMV